MLNLTKTLLCRAAAMVAVLLSVWAPAAWTPVAWSAAPLDDQRLARVCAQFELRVAEAMKTADVPGMAAVAVRGEDIVWQAGFGVRDRESGAPMTPETLIQVGSTTKSFTAALAAMQVDAGTLGWDDPALDHVPDFHMHDPWVTANMQVDDLMAQHSGMPAHAGDLLVFMGYDREHILRSVRHFPPVYSFRAGFSYVNNLFVTAARATENITGQSWEEQMRERILTPLNMTRANLDAAAYLATPNHATLYRKTPDGIVPLGYSDMLFTWPYVYGPAGGLNADALAMSRWVRLHLNRGQLDGVRLFSEASADALHGPRTLIHSAPDGTRVFYCLGWVLVDGPVYDMVWHNGGTTGIKAWIGFSPDMNVGLVLLSNLGQTDFPDAMAKVFFDLCAGVNSAPQPKVAEAPEDDDADTAPQTPTIESLPLGQYAGRYAHPAYGVAEVTVQGQGLAVRFLAPEELTISLRHVTMNTFAGMLPDVDPFEPFSFDFMTGEDGVERFVIREVDDGLAPFIRQTTSE